MSGSSEPSYAVEKREVLAETPDLRMIVLTLGRGEEVPWHWHSETTDTCIGMAGRVVIEMRAPRERLELAPGELCRVPPKRAHRVSGKDGDPCKLAILQGVGRYDFNPVGG